ncbi:TVP38/TMEM64 family protein [Thermoleptolyngbya sichuanensis A183]|uniref:TVP38/TMEM64 family membrane protein n=1 Tax=Thermoleptolyngbya sichuanensis A183 TaxID=2737172 RepID=A0A6M8BGY4_9CYAN|nr:MULTISPECIES: TVP38/TMEM64 family protein [Thermoleptolyngbya]QKD83596.1 TVP38/TMEM64 family protein [Thermoleptolyngbya sichuanensis A183]
MRRSPIRKSRYWLLAMLGLSLSAALAIATQHVNLPVLLANFLLWVKNLGTTGILAFILIYNLATLLFIPASLLTLGGGALYGIVWGTVYVLLASTLGAVFAFMIGRYVARGWICQWIQAHPQFQAIDAAIAQQGLKIVFLTRLSPLFPFNLLNYLFGITCVSLKDYVIGSLGMIPGTFLYVYFGSLVGDVAALHMPLDMPLDMPEEVSLSMRVAYGSVRLLGLFATIAVTVQITRIARRSLRQSLAQSLSQSLPQSPSSSPFPAPRDSSHDSIH